VALPGEKAVRLRELSLVDEGDHVIVGDPQAGVFVAVPPVGGVVIQALLAGASTTEAAVAAERFAGQPVDVTSFIARLGGLGFVAGPSDTERRPASTAALQQRRWLGGPAPESVRWLFGRAAWSVYAALFAFDLAVMIGFPQLIPRPRAAYDLLGAGPGPSLVALFPLATSLVAAHECAHWLAARGAGLTTRFGIDHRMYFVVFETDLSQLWTLPRRRRFGPLLAGLAIDSAVLAVLLAVELTAAEHWWAPPALAAAVVAALAFVEVAGMTWQCLLFLRTDLYGVLVHATGCHNLWRVKTLSLRSALRMLNPAGAAELAASGHRDRAVAAWFRWLWLAGYLAAGAWFAWFSLPLLARLAGWAQPGLATSPRTGRFWITIGCVAILAWRLGAPLAFTLRRSLRARTHRRSG